ncbi:MAG: tRNA lysidine(34) synthetase TilS [Candidatus Binatia bacterium]
MVQRSIRTHGMLNAGERVLVAVSGGADSVGLLLVFAQLRRKLGVELVAAHVNHHLRGDDAEADEQCAAAAATRLGVAFARADLDAGLARGGNLEARARRLRYAALHELAAAHGCAKIATGHTLDDQAETVLMRTLRGAGVRGLTGIRPRRADGVIRPLIESTREAVCRVVEQAGLAYRIDRSNADPRFLRTHVRERVLPLLRELNPSVNTALANLATAARAERAIVARWADAELAAAAPNGRLPAEWLAAQPAAVRGVLTRRWLLRGGLGRRGLGARHVQAVVQLALSAENRGEAHLPAGWLARRARGHLSVHRQQPFLEPAVRQSEKLF